MARKFCIRVNKRGRYVYILSYVIKQAYDNSEILINEADITKDSRGNELKYYNYTFQLSQVRVVNSIEHINTREFYLFDLCMDFKYLNIEWKKTIYFDTSEGALKVNFHNNVSHYLALNKGNLLHEINQFPYTPHPELIKESVKPAAIEGRAIHLLCSVTPNVTLRTNLLTKIHDFFGEKNFFLSTLNYNPTMNRLFLCSPRRITSFSNWYKLLMNSKWVLDMPGYGLITHRVVESCNAGCALLIHESSAKSYSSQFREDFDCIIYNENNIIYQIERVMGIDDKVTKSIIEESRKKLNHVFGTPVAIEKLRKLIDS